MIEEEEEEEAAAAAKEEEEEQRKEETRLLYVALTRAIEHLVVFVKPPSTNGSTGRAVDSWSDLIRKV